MDNKTNNALCKKCGLYNILCKKEIDYLDCEYNTTALTDDELMLEKIEEFTMIKDSLRLVEYNSYINGERFKIVENIDSYVIYFNGKSYEFNLISDNSKINNNSELYHELISERRFNWCHNRSVELSKILFPSCVLTGIMRSKDFSFLHSVVQIEVGDKKLIFDWTKNLIIDKETYIKLTSYVELSKISSEELKNDNKIISCLGGNICLKQYLVFREELINDTNKQKTLFL